MKIKLTLRSVFHIDHLIVTCYTLALIGLLVVVTVNVEFLNPVVRALEGFSMTDIYYGIQQSSGRPDTCRQITLVDMTELTRRDDIAHVIGQIDSLNPTVLGVDIIFEGRSGYDDADEELVAAVLGASTDVVLARKLVDYDADRQTYTRSVRSFFAADADAHEGIVNVVNASERSIAAFSVDLSSQGQPIGSMPAELARAVGAEPVGLNGSQHIIKYDNVVFPVVHWSEVALSRSLIEGRIVLLGTTKEERDMHFTPVGKLSGLQVLAYATRSMVSGADVKRASWLTSLLWALLAGWATNLLTYWLTRLLMRSRSGLAVFITQSEFYFKIVSFVVMVLLTWLSFVLYVRHNYYVGTVLALSTAALTGEGRLLYMGTLAVLRQKTRWRWIDRSLYADKV